MTAPDLSGKVAIVTGGSRGIGLAIGHAFAAAGAQVVLTSRKADAIEAAAAEVGHGAVGMPAHAADEDAARACVTETVQRFGRVDVLVNNAGTNPAFGLVLEQDRARYDKVFDVNLWGPIMWTRLCWEASMREHGGSVVNVASLGGVNVASHLGLYNVTKAALIHLTKQLALELAPTVRVNALAPGVVRTKLSEALWSAAEEGVASHTPLKRIGEPGDVASAALFLASDASAWITGDTLLVDGGQGLGPAAN